MVKLVYILHRRADVSPEDFYAYWLNRHGPLVRSFARAIRATRYVQSHTIETPLNDALQTSRGMLPPEAGITEVWWKSLEDLQGGFASEEGQKAARALVEDESTFIDLAQSRCFLTEEHTIFEGL
jgi:heme-degrading monooxygenase HmoA